MTAAQHRRAGGGKGGWVGGGEELSEKTARQRHLRRVLAITGVVLKGEPWAPWQVTGHFTCTTQTGRSGLGTGTLVLDR